MKAHSHFKECWEQALQHKAYPHFLRNIIRIDANEFVTTVRNADRTIAGDLVESVISGDAYVLKNAHSEAEIDRLRQMIVEWRVNREQAESEKILEGCRDIYKINDVEVVGPGYYQVLEHTHGFFRWNNDPLGIFTMLDPYWEAIKILSGHHPQAFAKSTPRDGVIDKLTIYQYPMAIGKVTTHYDPPESQKLLLNLPMGKVGRDYGYGEYGFYVVDSGTGKNIFLEHMMNFGDYICICPTVHHGATPPQPVNGAFDAAPDWESERGRWLLTAISVPSHHVKDRKSTVAVID